MPRAPFAAVDRQTQEMVCGSAAPEPYALSCGRPDPIPPTGRGPPPDAMGRGIPEVAGLAALRRAAVPGDAGLPALLFSREFRLQNGSGGRRRGSSRHATATATQRDSTKRQRTPAPWMQRRNTSSITPPKHVPALTTLVADHESHRHTHGGRGRSSQATSNTPPPTNPKARQYIILGWIGTRAKQGEPGRLNFR